MPFALGIIQVLTNKSLKSSHVQGVAYAYVSSASGHEKGCQLVFISDDLPTGFKVY